MKRKITLLASLLLAGTVTVFAQDFGQYDKADPKDLVKSKDLTIQQLEGIHNYYQFKLKNKQKADELASLLIAKDPQGKFARLTAFQKAMPAKNNQEMIAQYEKFLAEFPYEHWSKSPNGQSFIYYTVHRGLGTAYFETRQFDKLFAMLKPLTFKTENEVFRWNVMRAYVFKLIGQDTLYEVATPLIKELLAKVKDGSYVESGVFTPETAQHNANQQMDNELGTYISLLRDMKKYNDVKRYFSFLSEKGKYADAERNSMYLDALLQTKDEQAIQPFLEKCMAANAMTPLMLEELKKQYVKKNNSAEGYEAYTSSLRSKDEQGALLAYVKEHMTNEEFMPFAVEDADGKTIRSSDWNNRIVVIDFWATWCKPCIQAFPGMQLLVDQYSKDDKVKIFLMGTMQTGDYKEKSVGFVKREGYRFHLLHDNKNQKNGEQDAVFKTFVPFFKSSAIPRKVILKDGVMRYTSEGYSGSPSKLAEELSMAIEILKKEN
ncbi:TlpA family protein disulfide reductase [Pseudoflavitalea rhizosphaerae]|uniref:TlpA family protein disulfide reductase n=1 Tax=Pseudoflavitalea rhizosphaerae TaxID=1884793 RepID=UPI0013DF6D88|nr:TlpA disulfide reductase family protein [Pseudoflavitalea rhizosphaerae]